MADDRQLLLEIHDTVARLDERQRGISRKVERIESAVFGNGTPGLRSDFECIESRLDAIEKFENGCPIFEVVEDIRLIEARHAAEDKKQEENAEREKSGEDEYRKFRWGMLAMLIATAIDIILHYINVL